MLMRYRWNDYLFELNLLDPENKTVASSSLLTFKPVFQVRVHLESSMTEAVIAKIVITQRT